MFSEVSNIYSFDCVWHFNSDFADDAVGIDDILLEEDKLGLPVEGVFVLLLEESHGEADLADDLLLLHQLVYVPNDEHESLAL